MIRKSINYRSQIVLGIISIFCLIGFYSFLAWRQEIKNPNNTIMPTVIEILKNGTDKIATPDTFGRIWLLDDSKATFSRLVIGLGVGTVLSFFLGIAMGNFALIEAFLKWPIVFLAQIPATAMLAVFLVINAMTQIPISPMIVCFGILPTLTNTIYLAAKQDVHEELVFKAYTLGGSHAEVIWNVVVPQILPRIIDAIRICIGPALVYLIAAEWTNESVGFGYRLKIQGRGLHMDVVFIYLIILGCFGYMSNVFMVRFRNFVCQWAVK